MLRYFFGNELYIVQVRSMCVNINNLILFALSGHYP